MQRPGRPGRGRAWPGLSGPDRATSDVSLRARQLFAVVTDSGRGAKLVDAGRKLTDVTNTFLTGRSVSNEPPPADVLHAADNFLRWAFSPQQDVTPTPSHTDLPCC